MAATTSSHIQSTPITIRTGEIALSGDLNVPPSAQGIVLFAHGSGSSRLSPRNRAVAEALNAGGFATLLLDLLTPTEEEWDATTAALRFDIPFLAQRLMAATDWLGLHAETSSLPLGYFGASTGAAAALVAAANRPAAVYAVVSRGGRPDLAGRLLDRVEAPTLLIVGGADYPVIEMNREAYHLMSCARELAIVPGAGHLFSEPGALEHVTRLALAWYRRYLGRSG